MCVERGRWTLEVLPVVSSMLEYNVIWGHWYGVYRLKLARSLSTPEEEQRETPLAGHQPYRPEIGGDCHSPYPIESIQTAAANLVGDRVRVLDKVRDKVPCRSGC